MELFILKVIFRRLIHYIAIHFEKKAFTVDNDIYVARMVKRDSLQNSKILISLDGGTDDLRTRCLHQESISPKLATKLACTYYTDARRGGSILSKPIPRHLREGSLTR